MVNDIIYLNFNNIIYLLRKRDLVKHMLIVFLLLGKTHKHNCIQETLSLFSENYKLIIFKTMREKTRNKNILPL